GLNPFDSKARSGKASVPMPLPRGIGTDFAGVVTRVADGASYADVTPVSIGDEVLGWGFGSLREHFAVPAAQLARKPEGLSWAVAGSLSTPGQTAVASLQVLNPGPADTVLVSAAAGAVGFLYCQLAVAAGARVIGTASHGNHERLY